MLANSNQNIRSVARTRHISLTLLGQRWFLVLQNGDGCENNKVQTTTFTFKTLFPVPSHPNHFIIVQTLLSAQDFKNWQSGVEGNIAKLKACPTEHKGSLRKTCFPLKKKKSWGSTVTGEEHVQSIGSSLPTLSIRSPLVFSLNQSTAFHIRTDMEITKGGH